MTDFSGTTIGERIERYRKTNRMTRDQLADATDGVIGRDVIANLENGRRKDVTVSQLLALSVALTVPPTALMFDITAPESPIVGGPDVVTSRSVSNGEAHLNTRPMKVHEALAWCGFSASFGRGLRELAPAGEMTMRQVFAWQGHLRMSNLLVSSSQSYESAKEAGTVTKKQRFELGTVILQAWSAYRDATSMDITGLQEPVIAEEVADDLLADAVVQGDSPSF